MKHVLIGPYPPPLGGVSVYAYRCAKILNAQGHEVRVMDLAKRSRLGKLCDLLALACGPRQAVFHLNSFDFNAMIALIVRPFKGRVIFRDHSGRLVQSLGTVNRTILKLFLRRVDEVVLVAPHLREMYAKRGCTLPGGTRIEPAFLPPPPEDEPAIWETYEPETLRFVGTHHPLLIANAYKIVFHDGVDLYGLDMCVDLAAEMKKTYPSIGLLFALAEVGDEEYYQKINRRIDELGIRDSFHFMTGQKELWPLFRKADLMVRPTSADGDAVSLREALLFRCRCVASDACARPEGTVVFTNSDAQSLLTAALEALRSKEQA